MIQSFAGLLKTVAQPFFSGGAGGLLQKLPAVGSAGGLVQKKICRLRIFFDIQFKNTFNLILLSFKVPSERFFHKNFKTGLTF